MKKRILVLGGTRYVGKRLVQLFVDTGDAVTVGTRGKAPISFSGEVSHLKLDRFDECSMRTALAKGEWDVVYDQQCYAPEDAAIAIEILKGRAGRYILCSTGIVYKNPLNAKEKLFDPLSYPVRFPGRENVDYGEGKRLSEAVLFQQGTFSSVAVRFPIILGPDDYTERVRVQVQRVGQGRPVNIVNPDAKISLISSGEAASFLLWLSRVHFTGPFNACSTGSIALGEIVTLLEEATRKTATVRAQPDDQPMSLFWARSSFTLSAARAQHCGFPFFRIRDWLPSLVQEEAGNRSL
jgi:nucleoside-diphosphate-sugar epimerase